MEIYLIRHAQSKGNEGAIVQGQTDQGLSELGKEQAKELATCQELKKITAIYSSDLGRAIETATPLSRKLRLEIKTDPDLREAAFGIWENLTYDEVRKKFSDEYTKWHFNYFERPEWFESFESHFNRVKKAIEKILLTHEPNEKIAIVTHGGSIKTQLGYFNKLSGQELVKYSTLNCSLTLIYFNSNKNYEEGKIIYYNKETTKLIKV